MLMCMALNQTEHTSCFSVPLPHSGVPLFQIEERLVSWCEAAGASKGGIHHRASEPKHLLRRMETGPHHLPQARYCRGTPSTRRVPTCVPCLPSAISFTFVINPMMLVVLTLHAVEDSEAQGSWVILSRSPSWRWQGEHLKYVALL